MPTAAALRLEIEHALERRFPAALSPTPRTIYEVAATGIEAIDKLLHGGLPVGAISELTGAASSGRTSLALRFVAHLTAEMRPCVWVDVQDVFDPGSAAANGVQLTRLLWIRCRDEVGVATGGGCKRPTAGKEFHPTDLVDEARSGAAGDGSAVAGGWIFECRAGSGRYGPGASKPYSAGHMVPLQAGGGTNTVQPAGVGQADLCAVGRGSGAGVLGTACGAGRRHSTARFRVYGAARERAIGAGRDYDTKTSGRDLAGVCGMG